MNDEQILIARRMLERVKALQADLMLLGVTSSAEVLPDLPSSPPPQVRAKTFIEVARRGDYLVLDTETTGLRDAEICQIAIIDDKGQSLLDTLVKTTRPIPTDAQAIHGISTAMVQSAPTFAELLPTIKSILTDCDVIVYNAVYDRGMLHQSAEKAGIAKVEWKEIARWWCAMEAFAPIYGDWNHRHGNYKWQTLSTAARYYQVNVENAHTAIGDCLMTLGVVKAMAKGAVSSS